MQIKKIVIASSIIIASMPCKLEPKNIYVQNNDENAIEITITKELLTEGEWISITQNKLVARKNELHFLGNLNNLEKIKLEVYGKVKNTLSSTETLTKETFNLKTPSEQDYILIIDSSPSTPTSPSSPTRPDSPPSPQSSWSWLASWLGQPPSPSDRPTTPSTPSSTSSSGLLYNFQYDIQPISLQKIKEMIPTPHAFINNFDTRSPRYFLSLPKDGTKKDLEFCVKIKKEFIKNIFSNETQKIKELTNFVDKTKELLKKKAKQKNEADKEYILFEWDILLHQDNIKKGKELSNRLLRIHGSEQTIKERYKNLTREQHRKMYLADIINLIWYYYSLAAQKKQAFSEGTFIINPGKEVYKFLIHYVMSVNQNIKGSKSDEPLAKAENAFAYCRKSSHFKSEQKRFKHYGIDIRFQENEDSQPLLPAQKRHLFFGKLNEESTYGEDTIFIKPENYGLYGRDFNMHAVEFISSIARKVAPSLEPFLPTSTNETLYNYIGTDDDPNYRKERIPISFIKTCISILNSDGKTKETYTKEDVIKHHLPSFLAQGIKYLNYIVNQRPPEDLSEKQKEEFSNYLKKLEKEERFPGFKIYDHFDLRYGREVILTPKEFSEHN